MKKLISTIIILSLSTLAITAQTYRMENKHLARIIQVTDRRLHTQTILNKQAQTELTPTSCDAVSYTHLTLPKQKIPITFYLPKIS